MTKHRLMLSAATAALMAVPLAARGDADLTGKTQTSLTTSSSGNIYVESGGSIQVKSATPAITLNSNNVVIINGGGVVSNLDTTGGYGVLIDNTAGNIVTTSGTGFQSIGTIDLTGKGNSKIGVAIYGGHTFLGSVSLISGGSTGGGSALSMEGDDSTAVYLSRGTTIDGNVELGGSITHKPAEKSSNRAQTRLIGLDGIINGNVIVDSYSSLVNIGQGARGLSILGALQPAACTADAALYTQAGQTCPATTGVGALIVSGSVTTTGTLTPTTKGTNDEGGAALLVGASMAGGIEINGPATGFPSAIQGSLAGNGVLEPVVLFDPSQPSQTGFFGITAPILLGRIGTVTDSVDGADSGVGFSFINHGTIRAQPQDAELSTTAIGILSASAVNNVTFAGGLLNTGTISAIATTTQATHASGSDIGATAIYVGANTVIPNITVRGETTTGTATTPGSINAQVTGTGGGDATAILLGTGAQVPTINVGLHGTILASVVTTNSAPTTTIANTATPFTLVAEAIVDQSGNLKTINNGGNIIGATSQLNPAVNTVINNVSRAINLAAGNTGGVTISNTGVILGDVLFGAAGNGNVVNVGNVSVAVINATGNTATSNAYSVLAARIDSAPSGLPPVTEANTLNFGSGTGHTLNVGAYGYVNSVIKAASPGALNINLSTSGILAIANAAADGTVNANNFNVAGGLLIVPLAQSTSTIPVPVVTANSATIGAAATFSTQFTSFFSAGFTKAAVDNPAPQQIVLVKTPIGALNIDAGTLSQDNAALVANLPFLFRDPGATPILTKATVGASDELILTLTPKTPAELGLTGDAAALFPLASASLVSDPLLGAAIANNITVRNGAGAINTAASQQQAQKIFSQFTPDVSGGARQVAILITDQATGPVATRQRLLRSYARQPGDMTLWSTEFAATINNKGRFDADGTLTNYKDRGFGFSVGVDGGNPRGAWYGGAFTFYTGDISQSLPRTTKTDTEWYMLTGYTEWHGRKAFLETQVNVGYGALVGHRGMTVGQQAREAIGKRAALVGSLGATTGFDLRYGGFNVTPHISLDGMTLRENGYYETGGQALDLQVAPYYGNSLRFAPGIDFKKSFSLWDVAVTPEARIGYRYDFVSSPVKIKAGFISTGGIGTAGNSFSFVGPDPDTGNVVAGFSLGASTDTWQLGINYDWIRGNNGSTTQIGTFSILARI